MTDLNEQNKERRAGSHELIDHMLKERNQLLSLLLQATSNDMDEDASSLESNLDEFIQVLVDYIAAGHFGLYQRIAEGTERRKAVNELAVEIYPRIEQTTEIALAFEDKYNSENESHVLDHLQTDLSRFGEELTTRIELEDKLINSILG